MLGRLRSAIGKKSTQSGSALEFEEENDVESDVKDPGIFLLHNIKVEGKELLVFYDSGAGGAAISNRAYKYLDAANVRPGPTLLNVAGGSTVAIDGGDESFYLDLDELHEKRRARFTALKMSNITIPCVDTIQLGPSPVNSFPQCKKALYVIISAEFPKTRSN